jgi:enoyl-CoA hydratase/carnithine racemase
MNRELQPGSVSLLMEGAIAFVRLRNPAKFNAMSRAMWLQLKAVFQEIQNSHVRCVLVAGEGAHFCAGGDISEYPSFRFDAQQLAHFHETEVWGGLSSMLNCDLPVVAAIAGNCMGAGVEIASCCDMRVAGESAKFGAPIARLGFPMAPREAALVSSALGVNVARAMLLAAEIFPAGRLQDSGFLTRVVTDADIETQSLDLAKRIAALAPEAAKMNKQTLRMATLVPNAQTYAYADSLEHREGIAAFLDKRKPDFGSDEKYYASTS